MKRKITMVINEIKNSKRIHGIEEIIRLKKKFFRRMVLLLVISVLLVLFIISFIYFNRIERDSYEHAKKVYDLNKKSLEYFIKKNDRASLKKLLDILVSYNPFILYAVIRDNNSLYLSTNPDLTSEEFERTLVEKGKIKKIWLKKNVIDYVFRIENTDKELHLGIFSLMLLQRLERFLMVTGITAVCIMAISLLIIYTGIEYSFAKVGYFYSRLKESENRFKELFNAIDAGLIIYEPVRDGSDFIIKSINRTAEKIDKLEGREVLGKKVTEVFPNIEEFGLLDDLKYVFNTGKSITQEGRFYADERISGWRKYHIFRLLCDQIVAVYYDTTKERKLREIEEQIIQAQKLEAIGRLAGGVSHDFNNILTAILGYSELLIMDDSLSSEAVDFVREIRRAGEKASSLVRQLLAFSRQQVLEPKIINLNEIIKELSSMLKRIIGEDIELRTNLSPEISPIWADPVQIEQVIMNIVVNARDAMPNGGILTIETKGNIRYCANDQSNNYEPRNYVVLSISDTGYGMDEKTKKRIFEPFFTTKDKCKGTGLGLSTVYGIVKQSRGLIFVDSELGRGTTFSIYFPVCNKSGRTELIGESYVDKDLVVGRNMGKVLVVEDDENVRSLVTRTLEQSGFNVIEAEDGDSALSICRAENEEIELVIIDLVLPGMYGVELLNKIKELCTDIKVLFISGYIDEELREKELLIRAYPFLKKPFTLVELVNEINKILNYKNSHDESDRKIVGWEGGVNI